MKQASDGAKESFDYVVVGAGSAGCVLAARLSEDPGVSVLLIEAGPADRHPYVHIPAAFSRLFDGPLDWGYRTVPQAALGGRRVFWPRGRLLGGSSSLNAMMWVPGFSADFEVWAELAGPLWSAAEMQALALRVAHFEPAGKASADSRALEGDGPLPVTALVDPNPLTGLFLQAAVDSGLPLATSATIASDPAEKVGETLVNQHHGRRASAADAYLRPALSRANLTVRTGLRCVGICFEDRRAVGVVHREGRKQQVTGARREVVLAAGAIGSPQLLCCSGIGPGAELARLGIEVVADRPAVGRGLEDHLTAGFAVATRRRISLVKAQRPPALVRYLLTRRGPLTSSIAEACGFVRSDERLRLPDLELLFLPVAFLDEGLKPPRRHGISLAAVLLQPESRGSVRLATPDPAVAPRIDPAYLSDPGGHDRDTLAAGLRRCQRLLGTEPLAGALAGPIAPEETDPERAIEVAITDLSQTLYHPTGTCAIGLSSDAVLDPCCRVRGVDGLRVVDASAIPRLGHGHTHAPTVLLAERAAELIRRR